MNLFKNLFDYDFIETIDWESLKNDKTGTYTEEVKKENGIKTRIKSFISNDKSRSFKNMSSFREVENEIEKEHKLKIIKEQEDLLKQKEETLNLELEKIKEKQKELNLQKENI